VILLVDNYDSFTYNLAHYLSELGADVTVRRPDELSDDLDPTHLVLSPGPGRPSAQLVELVRASRVPTLGVCLGHQAVVEAFGGEIDSAQRLLHGKTSIVEHDGKGVFRGLPQGLEVGRYHSLAATRVPDVLEVSARSDDGEVMGVRHRELPIEGVQFHPESVLTPLGKDLLRNFIDPRFSGVPPAARGGGGAGLRPAGAAAGQGSEVRMRGLEPPRAFAHTDLNRARLPIPPHPRG
jgi:anthranilate synthase/aminodeoxychorismate synthase-like glutamine amidotransferase